MANIINIETSGKICSVAFTKDMALEKQWDDDRGMNHSTALAPFVESCLEEMHRMGNRPDAVAHMHFRQVTELHDPIKAITCWSLDAG